MWTYEASGDKSVADENYAIIVSWVQFCIHTLIILLHRIVFPPFPPTTLPFVPPVTPTHLATAPVWPHQPKASHA